MDSETRTRAGVAAALAGAALVILCGCCGGHTVLQNMRVVDGDTVHALYRPPVPMKESFRLLNIDTPERGKPGFNEAKAALARLLSLGPVSIEFEKPGIPTRDRYGRLLVYLKAGGLNINVEMVRLGHSLYITRYNKGRYSRAFRKAEKERDTR